MQRHQLAIVLLAVSVTVVSIGLWSRFRGSEKPPEADIVERQDVPLSARDQQFVGHSRCAECHANIAALHATTGHARTFALTKDFPLALQMCGISIEQAPPYDKYEYSCDTEGLLASIPDRFGPRAFPLDYAVGSGDHAVTFFTLLSQPTGETMGLSHRMTWYASDETFDITPGQEQSVPTRDADFFGRVLPTDIATRCIDCHTTDFTIDGDKLKSLYEGVQCEECHGPGGDHVVAAESGDPVSGIDRALSAADEMMLCGRCHRTASDITPERLETYPPSVVRFQPVGLMKSRCYMETEGGLRCSRCHDPHAPVTSRSIGDQEQSCRECHAGPEQVACPQSPQTGCIDCHMPAIDLVRDISFHDHWIRIRSDDGTPMPSAEDIDHTHGE